MRFFACLAIVFILVIALTILQQVGVYTVQTQWIDGRFIALLDVDTNAFSSVTARVKEEVSDTIEGTAKRLSPPSVAKGAVSAIDASNQTFTIQLPDGAEQTFHVNDTVRTEGAALQAMKAGDHVTVRYHVQDDKNIARSININRNQ